MLDRETIYKTVYLLERQHLITLGYTEDTASRKANILAVKTTNLIYLQQQDQENS